MSIDQEMVRYDRVRHIHVQISKIRYLDQHMHGTFELSYVLDGKGLCHQGNQTLELRPGTLIMANPYEPHSCTARTEKPLIMLTVQIHKLFLRRYIDCIPKLIFNST